MKDISKRVVIGSMVVAAIVALLSLMDLILKIPFGNQTFLMDILFLVCAVIILYLGWDTMRDMS